MRKNYSSIAKLFLMGAVVTAGVTFTSCSDDAFDATQSNAAQSLQTTGANDGTFLTEDTSGSNSYGVKFDGNNATITRGASASAVNNVASNATITYTDDCGTKGYLTINDGSLGVDQVPFIVTDKVMQLNFANNGGLVYLDKQGVVTRDAAADVQGEWGVALLKALAEFGGNTIGSKIGGLAWDQFASELFPESQDTQIQQKLDNVLTEIQELRSEISQMAVKNDMQITCDKYNMYWNNIHILHDHCMTYMRLIQQHKSQGRQDLVEQDINDWAMACIGGSNCTYQIAGGLEQYISSCFDAKDLGGHTWYNILDKYVFYLNDWETDGYAQRSSLRAFDLFVYVESLGMLKAYYEQIQAQSNADNVVKFFNNEVLPKFNTQSAFPKLTNLAISQIDGAYVVMEKTVGKKCIGTREAYGSNGTRINESSDSYFKRDGSWPMSYVFSLNKIYCKGQELYSLSMTKDEAKNLYANSKFKGSLYQILANQGVTGLDDASADLLIQCKAGADWKNWWVAFLSPSDATSEVKGEVWSNSQNRVAGYTFDLIRCGKCDSGFSPVYIFKSHNEGKWLYYTKVIKHYKDFDDLLSFEKQYEAEHTTNK